MPKKKKRGRPKKEKISKKAKKKLAHDEELNPPDAMIVRSQSSVEIKRGKDGSYSYNIKSYANEAMAAAKEAVKVDTYLQKEYLPDDEEDDEDDDE